MKHAAYDIPWNDTTFLAPDAVRIRFLQLLRSELPATEKGSVAISEQRVERLLDQALSDCNVGMVPQMGRNALERLRFLSVGPIRPSLESILQLLEAEGRTNVPLYHRVRWQLDVDQAFVDMAEELAMRHQVSRAPLKGFNARRRR
jgi:hypothetical protein